MKQRRLAIAAHRRRSSLTAAACGGSGGATGIASLDGGSDDARHHHHHRHARVDREQAMLDFTQCMRDQGIDMADPTADENGNFQMMRPSGGGEGGDFDPADREAMQAARAPAPSTSRAWPSSSTAPT